MRRATLSAARTLAVAPRKLAIALIRLYQSTASVRPRVCRFEPTCSQYALESIERFGVLPGVALGVRRIVRCNPFSPGGFDPAPIAISSSRGAHDIRSLDTEEPL